MLVINDYMFDHLITDIIVCKDHMVNLHIIDRLLYIEIQVK